MTHFKIVSVGWNCMAYLENTLRSIESQDYDDYEVMIVDDATPENIPQGALIEKWCETKRDIRDYRWKSTVNTTQRYATANQRDAIIALDPAPEDVIVFVDLDGDRLAHPGVLNHLDSVYQDPDVWLTYGNYRPIPDEGTSPPAIPFPPKTVANRDYRKEVLRAGSYFNHLRTMKGKVFWGIPEEAYHWGANIHNPIYQHGCDYIFMIAGLEVANGKYRCLDDVLLLYNHANPFADNKSHPAESSSCVIDFLNQKPVKPL